MALWEHANARALEGSCLDEGSARLWGHQMGAETTGTSKAARGNVGDQRGLPAGCNGCMCYESYCGERVAAAAQAMPELTKIKLSVAEGGGICDGKC